MNGNELAGQRRRGFLERAKRALGPAGIFFQGFLEHPRMVGSIIPSSRALISWTRIGPSRSPSARTRGPNSASMPGRLPASFGANVNPGDACSAQRENCPSAGSR